MPFGINNAPATFQRLVDTIFGELPFVCAYLDDIVIFSNDWEEHLEHIQRVLSCLREAKVKLNLKKCEFARGKIQFLGYVVDKNGIEICPERTKVIINYPEPSSGKDVQRFLGMCVGYQKFIQNFSEICLPLYDLTKKCQNFEWTSRHKRAFNCLKENLANLPRLSHIGSDSVLQLKCDASHNALG
ncbi:Transposon Ty3-G Gag-Pol polyprotein [Thelohanellus kitauei]|uniref:Transposon Ty3-G Gag-Pol polyprotein n=1 Tax=Thelohanellus kitauei TaxID=669202 RepID=A0A0C2NIP9_THEKT|nr:Transposon Ty3-G Gag-Pol polyprotein [Thelohanellus kitauei]